MWLCMDETADITLIVTYMQYHASGQANLSISIVD